MTEFNALRDELEQAGERARAWLLAARGERGWWEGRLSSSALSTAVALLALGSLWEEAEGDGLLIRRGQEWLVRWQNGDGGWGDTERSRSNIATTLLVWSAFGQAERQRRAVAGVAEAVTRAEGWLSAAAGGLETERLVRALEGRYGKDKTFAVPILMACAVGGRLGAEPECWKRVPVLPFELAALPREWFAALRLPVVSYALPALIAIGQARHAKAPGLPPWSWLRRAVTRKTRRLLREIQPRGGGFLEATPLTGFVAMALCAAGGKAETGAAESRAEPAAGCGDDDGRAVIAEAAAFLRRSVRGDGSWPIDTNLATWGTTLSVKALGAAALPDGGAGQVRDWLLGQQYRARHPYCLSAPGGWAWTDLPGGVPDADDTAGALLALDELRPAGGPDLPITKAAEAGARWLAGLQNADGGVPTFCRGWGALPFDRSAPDLTAHALAAWQVWRGRPGFEFDPRPAMDRAVGWLGRVQQADGSWLPLWFGNEHGPGETNPVYGTAAVLKGLCRLPAAEWPALEEMRRRAAEYLVSAAQPAGREEAGSFTAAGGGWGGGHPDSPPSIEETGAALEALWSYAVCRPESQEQPVPEQEVLVRGTQALLRMTEGGTRFPAAPVGLYFARLWYYEELYPGIAAVAAFRAGCEWLHHRRRREAAAGGHSRKRMPDPALPRMSEVC